MFSAVPRSNPARHNLAHWGSTFRRRKTRAEANIVLNFLEEMKERVPVR